MVRVELVEMAFQIVLPLDLDGDPTFAAEWTLERVLFLVPP